MSLDTTHDSTHGLSECNYWYIIKDFNLVLILTFIIIIIMSSSS